MEWLNYHHLLYFWTVVREGGFAAAAARLRLSHPTISAQVRALEEVLGEKLLERRGRRVEPTEMGRLVYRYADEIFSLGRELLDTVKGRPTRGPSRLRVGIADAVPKLVVLELLRPARKEGALLSIDEGPPDRLLLELAAHGLDVVLSDAPVPPGAGVRAYSHLLGQSDVTFYAAPKLSAQLRRGFPQSLQDAPLLAPGAGTALRRALEAWLDQHGLRPRIAAEIADSALLEAFGQEGEGVFPAPTAIGARVQRMYGVRPVGRAGELRVSYWALSAERRLTHPAVLAIRETAQARLF